MVKAVIFDFDGLLFNTEPVWGKTHSKFLKLKNFSDVEVGDTTGIGLREFIEILQSKGLAGKTSDLLSEYREIFYETLKGSQDLLMPGAMEVLKKAREKSLVISLNSGGHTEQKLKEMLAGENVLDYFSVIVSSDNVAKGKPAPDVYLETLNKLNLDADSCLAFEDSVNGVKSALGANITVWGVNQDSGWRSDLIEAGAEKVYSSLAKVNYEIRLSS